MLVPRRTDTNGDASKLPSNPQHCVSGQRTGSLYSAGFFYGCGAHSTVALGLLPAGHLASRPRAARRSPRVGAALGLLQRGTPPGHAVGAWLAAGALGHAQPHSTPTSPVTPLSEVPQPCPLPISRPGSPRFGRLCATVASCAGLKLARWTLCSQAYAGMTAPGARMLGARVHPGRAGCALRVRSSGGESPGRQLARRYEKVGSCALSSTFVEAWPRGAYRPLRARGTPGACAMAFLAPAPTQVQRSAGSEPSLWPRTLGPTSSSSSLDGQRGKEAEIASGGARAPPTPALARAQRPRPHD